MYGDDDQQRQQVGRPQPNQFQDMGGYGQSDPDQAAPLSRAGAYQQMQTVATNGGGAVPAYAKPQPRPQPQPQAQRPMYPQQPQTQRSVVQQPGGYYTASGFQGRPQRAQQQGNPNSRDGADWGGDRGQQPRYGQQQSRRSMGNYSQAQPQPGAIQAPQNDTPASGTDQQQALSSMYSRRALPTANGTRNDEEQRPVQSEMLY